MPVRKVVAGGADATAVTKVEPGRRSRPIGCRRDALKACAGSLPIVGNGLFRVTFRSGNVVYKVTRVYTDGSVPVATMNRREHEEAERRRSDGHSWAPPSSLYLMDDDTTVIAMPYYPKGYDSFSGEEAYAAETAAYELANKHDVGDMHEGNWRMTRGGQMRFIDLG